MPCVGVLLDKVSGEIDRKYRDVQNLLTVAWLRTIINNNVSREKKNSGPLNQHDTRHEKGSRGQAAHPISDLLMRL